MCRPLACKDPNFSNLQFFLVNATLEFKWGSDGMSGLPHFNQGFEGELFDDSKLYGCWIVPLRLILDNGVLVFNNPSPSSPRTCLPISLEFVAENADVTKRVREAVIRQELGLQECEIVLEGRNNVRNYIQTLVPVLFLT